MRGEDEKNVIALVYCQRKGPKKRGFRLRLYFHDEEEEEEKMYLVSFCESKL